VPKVETTQNHINRQKKNTWLILLTVTILTLDPDPIKFVNRISFPSLTTGKTLSK